MERLDAAAVVERFSGELAGLGWRKIRKHVRAAGFLLSERQAKDAAKRLRSPAGRVLTEESGDERVVESKGSSIQSLEQLLAAAGTDLDEWMVSRHVVNAWGQAQKGPDGRPTMVQLFQVKAWLERRRLEGVRPARVLPRRPAPVRTGVRPCAVFIPDTQIGFRWADDYQRLEPLHDRRAMDAVTQLVRLLQPEHVVLLGDMGDFAEWSTKFPRPPELRQTTQPTVDELHWWLTEWADAAPAAARAFVYGNHEDRARRKLLEAVPEGASLRAAGEAEPALSLGRLLRLSDLGYREVKPYGEETWVWDRIRVHHGDVVRQGGGATVAAALKRATHSEVFGHVHRVEGASKVIHGPQGRRVVSVMTPGCLCRTDGAVPAASPRVDWQNGVGLAFLDEQGQEHLHALPIIDGSLFWGGQLIQGRDRTAEIAAACGWRQMAA